MEVSTLVEVNLVNFMDRKDILVKKKLRSGRMMMFFTTASHEIISRHNVLIGSGACRILLYYTSALTHNL